jgi:hypothetical protein
MAEIMKLQSKWHSSANPYCQTYIEQIKKQMNPYVYSRKAVQKAQSATAFKPTVSDLAKHLASATVGTALAFAMVIFAAGSVASMTAVAYAEIGGASEPSVVHMAGLRPHAEVLGDSTTIASQTIIDDSALEAEEVSGGLLVKVGNFDASSGRFNVTITYKVNNLNSQAILSIGSYVIKSGITQSGSFETGAILKPDREYRAVLWTKGEAGKEILAKALIKTGKGKVVEKNTQMFMLCKPTGNSSASSTPPASSMCLVTKEGKVICPQTAECGNSFKNETPQPTLKAPK